MKYNVRIFMTSFKSVAITASKLEEFIFPSITDADDS